MNAQIKMNQLPSITTPLENGFNTDELQLSPIQVDPEYLKKWNESKNDFVVITRNGALVNESLYRVGGLKTDDLKANYFMLLKYKEAFYDKSILKMSGNKDPKHLSGHWCILDSSGREVVEFKKFDSPYLVKNSVLYQLDHGVYDIRTNKLIAKYTHSFQSKEFFFCTSYTTDITEYGSGIVKIRKSDASVEFFPD